jgi:hypothetical protein
MIYLIIIDGHYSSYFDTSVFYMTFQVRIRVVDDAWPNNPEFGVLTVRVNRNTRGPQLTQTAYSENIRASNPVGSTIVTIGASDPDGVSYITSNKYIVLGILHLHTYFFLYGLKNVICPHNLCEITNLER